MKKVAIWLDDLVARILFAWRRRLVSTRSELVRQALQERLSRLRVEEQERRHREGYQRHPVRPGEFDLGEDEQLLSDGS